MQVVLDDKKIDVIIEHKQNKNLYIRVTDNLELSVTCNKRVSEKEILDIINKNSKSLIKMYNRKLKELDNKVTLNSELLKKDIRLIDYVVVHELSHFKEANHSDKFWHEVSLRYPNYKEARKELNEV